MKKRLTSFLLIVAMLVTMIPGNALTALASEQAVAFESGLVASEENDSEADNTVIGTVDGPVIESQVEPLLANSDTDATSVTRIEWLAALVETFEMTVEEDNYPDNYYSDLSSDSEDYVTAMVATEFGLVDVTAGDALCPSESATREFAAHSLNLCLGYTNTAESYTFSESESVTYPDDIQVAVDKGWFTLTDGAFLPENALTVTEKDALITMATSVKASTDIDESYENSWELAEGVIDLTSGVQAQMTDENEYTLTDCTYELAVGDKYAVLIDGLPLVKKVSSLVADGTTYVIQTEDVALSEAFSSIDIQKRQASDLTQAVLYNSDAELEFIVGGTAANEWQDGVVYDSVEALGNQQVSAIAITESFEISDSVKQKYNLADGITADITCTVSDVYADYAASIWKGTAHVDVSATVTFSCNVSLDVLGAMGVAPSIELAKIPLAWGIGYFKVNLDLTLKGNVTLTLVEYVSAGVQYSGDEGFRFIKDFHKESFTIEAHAEASIGFTATVGFNCLEILKGNLWAKVGAKAVLDGQTYDDGNLPLDCVHVNAWLYASYGGSATFNYLFDSKTWSFSGTIYDQNNSPVRVSLHYEDGKGVDRCTRENADGSGGSGSTTATNSNTSTGRWKYYTPANSRYGYNGTSKGTGSNGQPYTIFEYELNDENKAKIISYHGNVSALTIPSTLDGYEVAEIGSSVFKGNTQLRIVVIPNSVVRIANNAFSECSELGKVTLSKELTSLGYDSFYNCDKLTNIEIPKSLDTTTKRYSYYDANDGSNGPFRECDNLKTVTFEEGTTQVAWALFANCPGLEEINIPATVTIIEDGAFSGCTNLKKIQISNSVGEIDVYAFYNCKALEEVIIPDSVTAMGTYVFAGCTNLQKAVLPAGRKNITEGTFKDCTSLTDITIPSSVQYIRKYAFQNSGLTQLEIPDGVLEIEDYAFQDNVSLATFTFGTDSKLQTIGNHVFRGCDALTAITIPNSVTSIGTYIFAECDSLADVTLGTGITTIPSYAFNLCPSLVSIVIPYRVTTINSNAFTNCTKLAEVTIPRATTTIADGVFSYPGKMTIYGITGTYAETYANENSITFVNREVPATALTIQPAQLQLLKGKTAQLALSITPANFTDTITWRSSDTAVATVADGKVTAVAGGTATISALAGDTGAVKATCVVTVVQPVTRVNIDKSSITMEGGDTYTLVATVTPDTAHDKTLLWTSSDETVATVSREGVVTALKKGTTKITATAQDGSEKSDYCNVTVNSTAHIVTSVEELQSIHPYANNTNEVWIYTLENADGLAVTFSSETALDDGYDFVYIYDGEGNQVGKYTGTQLAGQTIQLPGNTVKIQLTSDDAITGWGFKVDAVTSVGEIIALESIALDKKEMVLKPGETAALTVTYNPSDTTVDKTVSWSSSNEKVATVASDGTVTAVAVGTATITAKVGEKEATCAVVVTQDTKNVITLSVETLKLHHKENAKLTYTMEPSDANIQTLQAVSSAEDVVSVKVAEDLSYVEVTGLKAGTAVITVTADEKISATCTVTVEDTITLDYQDGTGKTETIKVAYGEALTALASIEPAREGYLFVGWYTEANGKGSRVTKDTILSNQWVLYAYWRIADVEFWIEPIEVQMYTGKAINPAIVVYDGLTLLEEKKDYTISYKNNVNANDASDISKAPMAIVKGKGNYTGTLNVTFKILPQNIEGSAFAADDMAVKYNAKKVQKMVPSILWNGKKLKVNKDFTVSYPDTVADAYKALGTYTVQVTGTGNFTGERELTLTITEGNLMSKAKVAKIAAQAYQNGKPITPAVSVKMGKETLTEGVHYEVRYENNCEVGTASAVIVGKAGYSGVKRVTFKITGTALNKANISGLQDKVYNGRAQTQALKLNLNGAELKEGKDYVLSYSKNVNVGKATVVITGIGQYSGAIKKNFKITASNLESTLSGLQFVVDGQKVSGATLLSTKVQMAYTKGGSKPTVEIYSTTMDKRLVEGKDFVMSYAQNKSLTTSSTVKLPTMIIKGKGNFAGTLTKTFEIVPKNLSDVLVLAVDKQSSEKAGGFISKPILTDVDGKSLKEKTDYLITGYTVKYADGRTENVDAASVVSEIGAEVTVKVVGQGAYAGTTNQPSEAEVTYRITAKGMKGIKVAAISKEYTGTAITLTAKDFENSDGSSKVTIKENGVTKNLIYGKDFEIVEGTYTKNLKKGTATVTIKGLGEYGGTTKVKFKITQKNISFK